MKSSVPKGERWKAMCKVALCKMGMTISMKVKQKGLTLSTTRVLKR